MGDDSTEGIEGVVGIVGGHMDNRWYSAELVTDDTSGYCGFGRCRSEARMTEIEKDAARYRWLVRNEYISSELWNDFGANTGDDPSAIIDYQMQPEKRLTHPASADEIMENPSIERPDDICYCGDYCRDHDERGCRLCRYLPTPASPGCREFRFSRRRA